MIELSFSSKAKEELCRLRITSKCCARAALSSWVHMAGSLQLGRGIRLRLVTENYSVARWGLKLVKMLYPVEAEIYVRERKRLGKNRSFSIVLSGDNIGQLLKETNVLSENDAGTALSDALDYGMIEGECCKRAFLRGAFIGSGSISNPEKGYHLEFVVRSPLMEGVLMEMLGSYDLGAKSTIRKGRNVVYIKESDKITDFLTLIGAHGALLDLENVRAYKDFRNQLNRKVNCETANLQKTASAAARQIESIRFLIEEGALSGLQQDLQQTALLRLNNPDLTLIELGEMLSPPVGKSGVNHRLRKLDEFAQKIKLDKGVF